MHVPLPQLRAEALHLRADGRWRASDGCNGLGGRYDLGEEGSFDATGSFSFQVACMNVLHEDVLTDAAVVLVDGDVLTLQDGDGAVLAEYERSA